MNDLLLRKTINIHVYKKITDGQANFLINLCREMGVNYKKEWQAKYNHYIIYDYEPFCPADYHIMFTISGDNVNKVEFVNYLFKKHKRIVNKLNKQLE